MGVEAEVLLSGEVRRAAWGAGGPGWRTPWLTVAGMRSAGADSTCVRQMQDKQRMCVRHRMDITSGSAWLPRFLAALQDRQRLRETPSAGQRLK